MQLLNGRLVLSPSDLNDYVECPHLTGLSIAVARGARPRPHVSSEQNELLRRKGQEHEAASLARLREQAAGRRDRPPDPWDFATGSRATVEAMRAGAEIIYQAAEAATHIEACRLLCYRALWLADHGQRYTKESAMTKWWAPRLAVDTIHQCLLLHGHYRYTDELPFEQRMRDVIGLEIGDGTAEVMKVIVARELMGRESLPY